MSNSRVRKHLLRDTYPASATCVLTKYPCQWQSMLLSNNSTFPFSLPRSCCCRWPRTSRGSTSWSAWFRWISLKELIWTKQFINCNYPFGYNPLENRILLTLNLRLIFPAPKLLLHGCEVPRLLQDHHGECQNTLLSQPWWDDFILALSFCLILYFPLIQLPPACRCSLTLRQSLSARDVPPCSASPPGAGQG